MKKLNIIFLGTPDFAVESLKKIHLSNHNLLAVVTSADKPSGRGQKVNISAVKKYALENNLNIFQPEKLSNKNFIQNLKTLNADVFVVVAFRFLPKSVWEIPKLGTFNLHASLLPDYRGAAPINFAIINGEEKTGVTTFLIDQNIDTGKILLQKSININPEDNAGTLHDKLMVLGSDLVIETLNKLAENSIIPKIQTNDSKLLAYKIFKDDCLIDWNKDVKEINDFIRGLAPFPCAFTKIYISEQEKILKIYSGKYLLQNHTEKIGTIKTSKNQIEIYCKNGIYIPEIVQLEGKKQMEIKNFINGLNNKNINV